jgi:hypothetical protein
MPSVAERQLIRSTGKFDIGTGNSLRNPHLKNALDITVLIDIRMADAPVQLPVTVESLFRMIAGEEQRTDVALAVL